MKSTLLSRIVSLALISFLFVSQTWATCGGGGGGGMGGMAGGSNPQVYMVPWKLIQTADTLTSGVAGFWLPSSPRGGGGSRLWESRTLSTYAQQCVTMGLVDYRTALGQKLLGADKLPVAVLVQSDGTVVAKLQNKDGKLSVGDVEKMVDSEMKKREAVVKEKMES